MANTAAVARLPDAAMPPLFHGLAATSPQLPIGGMLHTEPWATAIAEDTIEDFRTSVMRRKMNHDYTRSFTGTWQLPVALGTPSRKQSFDEPVMSRQVTSALNHQVTPTMSRQITPEMNRQVTPMTPTMTPKVAKHQVCTPPPRLTMFNIAEEVNNDVAIALRCNSVNLLSLALCSAGSGGILTVDHSLHEALDMKCVEAVTLLLEQGSKELLHEPCAGMLPLGRALKNSSKQNDVSYGLAKLILQHGADPNLGSGPFCNTPLHQAAAAGAIHAVSLLLEFGADPNATNLEGFTPLHSLCQASTYLPKVCKEQVVVALLKKGADPTKTTFTGFRAADYLESPMGPSFVMMHNQKQIHGETNMRITERLSRATFSHIRLQLILAQGHCETDRGFSRLPVPVLEKVLEFGL